MRSFLVLLLGCHAGLLAAQSSAIHVDHFTADDGLAQNLVTRVLQDRAGFIWVGTKRGLQRYDGYSFVQYTSLNRNAPPALDALIGNLEYDGNDHLWASAQGSLYRISLATHRVARIELESPVQAWSLAPDGRVWILDKQRLKVLESAPEARTRVVTTPPQFRADANRIRVMRSGAIWVCDISQAPDKCQQLDPGSGAVRWIDLKSASGLVTTGEDSRGRLWLAGRRGVDVLDPGSERVRSIEALRGIPATGLGSDGGTVLVATPYDIYRLDGAGTVIQRWNPPILVASGGLPRDVMRDREGGVWLGTTTSGLFRFDSMKPVFDYMSSKTIPDIGSAGDFVTALRELADSSVWIGTLSAGAYRLNADGSRAEVFRYDPRNAKSLRSDMVWDFEEDRSGTLWLATGQGLCARGNGGFSCYLRSEAGHTIADIAQDAEGWFWAAEYETNRIISFNPATRKFGAAVQNADTPIAVYADPDSSWLWVGGNQLLRAKVRGGQFVTPLQPVPGEVGAYNVIYQFYRDGHGKMWIASESGLQHWDGAKQRFTPLAVPELKNTTVFSIVEDELGRLWLGTAHGLVHYSPASGQAQRYRKQDGVLSSEFNRRAALQRRNGEMMFGGVQGITRFRPGVVTAGRPPAPVVFTRLKRVTEKPQLGEAIDSTQLKLNRNDRAFTIEFAALTYAAGPVRRYRYQLENLTKDWIETTDHAVTYATPPPGHYVFRVQTAAGSDGEWSTPGSTLSFQVVPSFWRTGWFRSLIALAVIAGLWMLHRLRIARVLATERVRMRISRDLHDEIGVGLSSIALLSESVGTSGEITERDRTRLDKITQAARRMVADLRDIIWAIDPDEDHVEDVVARMRDEASVLLRDMDVSFQTPPASELAEGIGMAARRDLLLIFKEVLHNIARHAHAREVRIELSVKRDRVQLIVSDNGVGFDPEVARTGTGVKSMRERAARLGGRLDIVSRPGQGTSIVLTLRARERAMAGPLAYR